MKRFFRNTTLLLAAALMLHSCFKDTVNYTRFNLAVYDQVDSDAAFNHAEEIDSYAFYADTTEWYIASWDDAVAHRITNKTTGQTLDVPDVVGEFNPDEQYQTTLQVEQPVSMLVVVNPELKLYAYRKYELPENLPEIYAKLYMAAWRPTHNSSGWIVVNRFYADESSDEKE